MARYLQTRWCYRCVGLASLVSLVSLMAGCSLWAPDPGSVPFLPLPETSAPPPPPPGSFLGQLSPEHTHQLTSLGIAVVVPGVVSPDFQVIDVRVDHRDQDQGYAVIYRNPQRHCFGVEFARGEVTDPPPTQAVVPIRPPLFEGQPYDLHYGRFKNLQLQPRSAESNLYSDWLRGASGAYRLVGAAYIRERFPALGDCQDVALQTAVKLVESFTLLSAAPQGDGVKSTPSAGDLGFPGP